MSKMQLTNPYRGKTVRVLFELLKRKLGESNVNPEIITGIIDELNFRELSEEEAIHLKTIMNLLPNENPIQKSNLKKEYSEKRNKKTEMKSNIELTRYSGLKIIIYLLSTIGYTIIAIGVIAMFLLLKDGQELIAYASLAFSIIVAIPLIAFSNLIDVLIDIEYNTRKTKEAINELIK